MRPFAGRVVQCAVRSTPSRLCVRSAALRFGLILHGVVRCDEFAPTMRFAAMELLTSAFPVLLMVSAEETIPGS